MFLYPAVCMRKGALERVEGSIVRVDEWPREDLLARLAEGEFHGFTTLEGRRYYVCPCGVDNTVIFFGFPASIPHEGLRVLVTDDILSIYFSRASEEYYSTSKKY